MDARSCRVVLLVLATVASGCVGLGGGESLHVPPPAEHERFVYEGPNETRLTVEVDGFTERVGHHLRVHDALILNVSIETPHTGERPFRIWEALDPGTGWLVQQTARCGWTLAGDCTDERALVVLGTGGLPGGFGAASLWGDRIDPGATHVTVPTERLDLTDGTMTYTVGSANGTEEASPCIELDRPTVDRSVYRTYASSFRSPITVCDGIPLPIRFEAGLLGAFELVEHQPGSGARAALEVGSGWERVEAPVPPEPWSGPVAVHDPDDPTPFPVETAHEVALEKSSRYAELFDRAPESLVLGTGGVWTGYGESLDTLRSERDQRGVTAFAPDGNWVEVDVERRRNSTGPSDRPVWEETEYRIVRVQTGQRDTGPDRGSLAAEQAPVSGVYRVAERLTGQEPSDEHSFFSDVDPAYDHQPLLGGTVNRTDGWTIRAFMEDPSWLGGGGIAYHVPYQVSVDGPTGAVMYLTLNRSRLPLTPYASP